ncbi:MAG: YciI family protein [Devosia sp.]|jgi:hypothetical protein|nr:YciI family protein [Devosia sp.]
MQFLLLINGDESRFNTEPQAETPISPEFIAYTEAMKKAGVWMGGDRLKPTRHGARVRVRDGKAVVLDGPYADAKEQLGGYYMIDVPSLDEAVEWATRCPAARFGTIDVRPLAEISR